jgi:uncharacterized protein (TIGR03437 family)
MLVLAACKGASSGADDGDAGLPQRGGDAGDASTSAEAGTISVTSAATPLQPAIAPDSIAAARGAGLASADAGTDSTTLPTDLLGTRVTLGDRAVGLFGVSDGEIRFLVPSDAPLGQTTVTATTADGRTFRGDVAVNALAPAIFTAGGAANGPPAAYLVRVVDGGQTNEDVARFDATQGKWVPIALDVVTGSVVLVLTTTGLRARSSLSGVSASIGGAAASVLYAGPYPSYEGADQLNVAVPSSLAGRGAVTLGLVVDGVPSNLVDLVVQ